MKGGNTMNIFGESVEKIVYHAMSDDYYSKKRPEEINEAAYERFDDDDMGSADEN